MISESNRVTPLILIYKVVREPIVKIYKTYVCDVLCLIRLKYQNSSEIFLEIFKLFFFLTYHALFDEK